MQQKVEPRGERSAAVILLMGQIAAAGAAFAVNLLAARILEPAGRGDLAFVLQLAYLFTVVAVLGVERPFMASRSGSFNNEYVNFTRMIAVSSLCVTPFVVLAMAVSPLSVNWLWAGVAVIAAYVVLNAVTHGLRVAYVASRQWRPFAINTLASQCIIVAGAALLAALGQSDPVVWAGVYLLATAPVVLLLLNAVRGYDRDSYPQPVERRTLRRHGVVLLPSEFSSTAMLRLDRLLLPLLSTSAELGLYVTVATVLEMSSWPIKQWVDVSLRGWSAAGDSRIKVVRRILVQSIGMLVALTLALGAAAYVIIVYFLPESYLPAVHVITPLGVGSVIFGLTRVQQGLLIARGNSGAVSVVEIIGIVVSLVMFFLLIPPFGMLGAAYGSIVGYVACLLGGAIILFSPRTKGSQ